MRLQCLCVDSPSFKIGSLLFLRVAGSETASASITAILLLLVNNPGKLEVLKKEIDPAFEGDKEVTFAKLQELSYLNAVLWEGLRLMSPTAGNYSCLF